MWDKKLNYFWAIGIFIVLPLVMTNGYSNITITKVTTFGLISITAFFWMFLLRYFDVVADDRSIYTWVKSTKRFSIIKVVLLLFLLSNIITALSSGNIMNDLNAAGDKHMGLVYVIMSFMLYAAIRYGRRDRQDVYIAIRIMGIGVLLAIFAALLQFMGADYFNFLGNLSKLEVSNFLSTMGNTAVFGKYICVVCPVVIYYLSDDKSKLGKAVLYIVSMMFPCGVIVSNTDAAFIGLGIAVLAGLILALYYSRILEYIYSFICGIAGMLGLKLIYSIVPHARVMSRIGRFLISSKMTIIWCALLILLITVICLHYKCKLRLSEKIGRYCGIALIVICVVTVLGTVGAFIYFSFVNTSIELGGLENYLRFGKNWGTGRGTIWRWCIDLYSNYSLKDKLFGAGHGMVPQLLKDTYWSDMKSQMGYYFDNAHNYFLHQLLTIGFFGVISYIFVLIAFFIKGIRKKETAGFAVAIIIYIIVGSVCICEPISDPFIWVIFALISSATIKE